MGLDTSHDCWHGPYSAFMRWRTHLHFLLSDGHAGSHGPEAERAYCAALDAGLYSDQTVPLNVLMEHSDCEGSIPSAMCGPLADALEALVRERMPPRALADMYRPATERFIAGLRAAAAAGVDVEFG